ncbi:methyltransferase domain-containing protein [Alkalibaculum sp. M08DMB]|uniref:tRNA 5-hydroxyuridine methyltransferase n=1 Tax=Alkalibaculum sporogenes TaxID=2655001 RepID=A0A6A7KA09_9FIRM|nr:O-methyltransferase [Alkalibaculum sporogenes]MPW26310.1 methyltransferase domain-containing protein [Alkalibaculum sporogenes]
MGTITQDYIENYIRNLIIEEDSFVQKLELYSLEHNVPIIHPEVKQFLSVIIKSSGIKSILEVGTAIGYSSIVFCNAMNNGKVVTIEINEDMKCEALKNIDLAGYNNNIEVILGDANHVIKEIRGQFDCIFLDGAKGHYIHLLDTCLELLKPGGILISDNVLFRGMVANNELVKRRKITIVKRMRKYLEVITSHRQLKTSIIPIGDGVALSYKLKD